MDLVSLFTNIADAIRGKKGTEEKIRAVDFASEIESIEVGSSELVSKDVDFIDYDGTLLYSYTLEEIQAMTELPPLPTQEGLICQEWNWSLEDIKEHNRRLIVGATYITDDGKTRIYIDLTSEERLEMPLCFRQSVSHGIEIDWGDGSPVETFDSTSSYITPTHKYEKIGKYVATFNPIGECVLTLGSGGNYSIVGATSSSYRMRYHYLNVITNIEIGRNIISIPDSIFRSLYNLSTVVIPNTVTSISGSAFSTCYNLITVVIPKGVTSIGYYAFQNCYNLSTVAIPNAVTSISSSTFSACSSLSEINMPNNVLSISDSAFYACYDLTTVVIPNGVTSINSYTFQYCYILTTVVIPNGVTSIGDYAFQACYNLSTVIMPNTITSIGVSAFSSCTSLIKVMLSNNIINIPNNSFQSCYSLPEIKIPNNVLSIGNQAFANCYSLKKIDFSEHTQVPVLENTNAFNSAPSDRIYIVPDALYDEWIAATNWSNYADYIVKVSEVA